MCDLLILAIHLVVTFAKLLRPGSVRAIAAESLLLKHQLLISNRSRQRPPNPTSVDRVVLGLATVGRQLHLPALVVMDVFTRRIVGFGVERASIDGVSVCRMFNRAIAGERLPKHLSTDHDPLFRFHRWLANLRVLEIDEIKSVPYAPVSHLFVERLIGTIRREYLDRIFFLNAGDLARKLGEFRDYYNADRVHRALAGSTWPAVVPHSASLLLR